MTRLSRPRLLVLLVSALAAATAFASPAAAKSRIKDIVFFEGIRGNQLVGTGLVTGLNGTGDSVRNSPLTKQQFQSMLERLGMNTRDSTLDPKNIAAVTVIATLPPFAAPGAQVDVTVSSAGDAKSLLGGTLIVTPLLGGDGQVYAVAQGTVQTGAVSASGASGSSVTRGVPTAGRIASGAVVERESGFRLSEMKTLRMTLRNPDFTTARRIAEVVNLRFPGVALAENPSIIALTPPAGADMVSFITGLEQLEVEPDTPARVVIDEVAGVIVMGQDVRISTVAIMQGNLTISVSESSQVSQPGALSSGATQVTPKTAIKVDEEKGKRLILLKESASLATLVKGLNALGVSPRDMISILQTIKAAGALQADIEVL